MESLEELQGHHRKEVKDLQARITQKKKQATKKTRKGVNSECEEQERQLKEKHERELSERTGGPEAYDVPAADVSDSDDPKEPIAPKPNTPLKTPINAVADTLAQTTIASPTDSEDRQPKKRNRQKERLARRAAEQDAEALKAEEEAAKLPNWKRQERIAMLKAFKENNLVEKEIRPDGHCLFSSVADQLTELGIPLDAENDVEKTEPFRYRPVRRKAAKYIETHPEEFQDFLDEPLFLYTSKIENSAEWGGHLELIALAKSYQVEICVLQDSRVDRFSPGNESGKEADKIWLAYYHHGYGLGEHYNSLRKAP
jgi:OTU domain-containing protein 6